MKAALLTAGETRARIRETIEKTAEADRPIPLPDPAEMRKGRARLVRRLPSWVERFGLLAKSGSYFLWCEPVRSPGEVFPGQMIVDVPPGRYMIEILDIGSSHWVSRESAEGGPLVAGLPFTGEPVLVWIRLRF